MLRARRALAGRYLLGAPIAHGAFGCIYEAYCLRLRISVVVKMPRADLAQSPAWLARFRRETELASRVSHPNIVRVLDFGHTEEGLPFLVMEHVTGHSLAKLVQHEGAQPLPRVIALMRDLLAALDELHAGGLAHGDVKADNLLLQPTSDGGERLKLVDFGIAARLGGARRELREDVCGTPGYIAPEVILGAPPSVAADVYAAGVVLYELLTGSPPFAGSTAQQILENQLGTAPTAPSVRRRDRELPAALDALVERTLARDPARRPSAAALAAALAGEDLVIPFGTTVTAARSPRTRTTTLVGTAAFVRRGPGMVRPPSRLDRLHRGIGRALRDGEVDQLVELYLGVATLLCRRGDLRGAEAELAEAINLVTSGVGATANSGPEDLWRLLLMLGDVQSRRGSPGAARDSVESAYRHADRVSSTHGRACAEGQALDLSRAWAPASRLEPR